MKPADDDARVQELDVLRVQAALAAPRVTTMRSPRMTPIATSTPNMWIGMPPSEQVSRTGARRSRGSSATRAALRLRACAAPARCRAGRRRGSWSGPSGPTRRAGSPAPAPRALSAANSSGCTKRATGRCLRRRAQVLAERQDVDADLAQLAQHRAHLVELLAEAEHEAGLGDRAARLGVARGSRTSARSSPARAPGATGAAPSPGCARTRRGRRPSTVSTAPVSPLKSPASTSSTMLGRCAACTARIVAAQCAAPPSGRSSRSTQVMTVCRRPSSPSIVATCSGSSGSGGSGRPVGHVAELAGARADAAQDHDGQRLAVPALADVRAGRALADGVQPQLGDALLEIEEDLAARHLHPDPVGLRLELRARVGAAPAASARPARTRSLRDRVSTILSDITSLNLPDQ